MPRPEFPKVAKGDTLLLREGRSLITEVRVTGAGAKFITVIPVKHYGAFLADPAANRWRTRRFLIEDQMEGERGKRVGYPVIVVTREQADYDARLCDARAFLNDKLGLIVKDRTSPFADPDRLMTFVEWVRFAGLHQVIQRDEVRS